MGASRPRWTLVVAGLTLALATSCSNRSISRETTIVDRRRLAPFTRPAPEADTAKATFEMQGADAVVRVDLERACFQGFLEEQTVRETETRRGHSGVGPALALTGLGLATLVLVRSQTCHSRDIETGQDQSCDAPFDGFLLWGGIGLTAAGLTVLGAQVGHDRRVTRTSVRTVPVAGERTVCARASGIGRRVELEFESGQRLGARIDPDGNARIAIPDELWAPRESQLECSILLDGKRLRRVTLRREGVRPE